MEEPLPGGDKYIVDTIYANMKSKSGSSNRKIRRSNSLPETSVMNENLLPRSEFLFQTHLPSFKSIAIFFILYVAIGTVCFYFLRDQIKGERTNGILDSVYFCIVTITTVGYGDLVPSSVSTKLLSCVFAISGVALVGVIVSKGADHLVEKQQKMLIALGRRSETPEDIESDSAGIKRMIDSVQYRCFLTIVLLVVLVIIGAVFLASVEKLDLFDAFYCVCSTLTTLGYGDKSFSTTAGRIFAIFWTLASTLCLVRLLWCVAEINTERRYRAFNWYIQGRS